MIAWWLFPAFVTLVMIALTVVAWRDERRYDMPFWTIAIGTVAVLIALASWVIGGVMLALS